MTTRTRIGATLLAGVILASGLGLGGLGGCVVVIGGKGRGDWDRNSYSHSRHSRSAARPFIGVTTSGLSESLAAQLDVKRRRATLITSVESGRPAEQAGLKKWDVVIEIDGDDNAAPDRFRREILDTDPGDTLELTILREGEVMQIDVEPEPKNLRTKRMYED